MPKGNDNQEPSLFDEIQRLQSSVARNFTGFTNADQEALEMYSAVSRAGNYQKKYSEDLNSPDTLDLKQISERLGTLAAHYPKNSPELAVLREQVPDIGKLRKEKMEALRADASRSGMDKLLNDFLGSKKRAAKEELEKMHQSRTGIDDRVRTNTVKAPEHAGRGRNILTAITNASGLGSHETRHDNLMEEFNKFGNNISFRTKSGLLDGVEVPPTTQKPNGKYVLLFSGSGKPAEHVIEDIAEGYSNSGTTVIVFNYRGFGNSKTLDINGKQVGTPLSEQTLYEDGMEMYKFVRDVMGVSPANITLHGYSLGAAVASHVAANVAEQNKLKMDNHIPVPDSKKLGGVVMQSPMESMYAAGKQLTNNSSIAGFLGSRGSGAYDTRGNLQRLFQNDPEIPVVYISGKEQNGDYLSLDISKLHLDPKAPFQNSSVSFAPCGHLNHGEMLALTTEHVNLAVEGRNVQLNNNSIQRQGDAPVQEQAKNASIGL